MGKMPGLLFRAVPVVLALGVTTCLVEFARGSDLPSPPKRTKGESIGPFSLTDLDGRRWTESDLFGRTAVVIVWRSRCGFCIDAMPDVEALAKKFAGDSRITVLTMTLDVDRETVRRFAAEHGLTVPVLLAGEFMGTPGTPSVYFVDRNGKILEHLRGYGSSWLEHVSEEAEAFIERDTQRYGPPKRHGDR